MVRPTKASDIKANIVGQPSYSKAPKATKADIENRFPIDVPLIKKATMDKTKFPGQIITAKAKTKNQNTKPTTQKGSKMTKTLSQQQGTSVKNVNPLPQSKSHTIKPLSPITQKRVKTKGSIKKKKPVQAKSEPMNQLLKISDMEDQDRTSLPFGEQFTAFERKPNTKMGKIEKVLTNPKKASKKSTQKTTPKEDSKLLTYKLNQEESGASLTTNFRMPYPPEEVTEPVSNAPKKMSSFKRRRTSTLGKIVPKAKANQEEITTKETSSKRKSKLQPTKLVDRILSSDSVLVFPVKEIKHNDSFIISARKLQNSPRVRRQRNSERLKLHKRISSITRTQIDKFGLKSCLKKPKLRKNKSPYSEEFIVI